MTLALGYHQRATEPGDLGAVVGLMNRCGVQEYGVAEASAGELCETWADVELAHDTCVVLAPDGAVVGYVELEHDPDQGWQCSVFEDPEHLGHGISECLLLFAEQRAGGDLWVITPAVVVGMAELLRQRGYRLMRCFHRMTAELADLPTETALFVGGARLRPFEASRDARAVHELLGLAYAEQFRQRVILFEDWARHKLDGVLTRPDLWIVAEAGGELIGVAVNELLSADTGWVSDLGVAPAWRQRGIGRALLEYSFATLAEAGATLVSLGVDTRNESRATSLYAAVGMQVERRYDFWRR